MAIDATVCNTEIKSGLWSKGERRMKYEKPEMEILEFNMGQVFTLDVSGAESDENPAPGNGTGGSW